MSVVFCVVVAYRAQSSQVFHNCSSRSVSRSVASVSQQIHGGEPLIDVSFLKAPVQFLPVSCDELLLLLSVCHLAGTCCGCGGSHEY